MRHSQAPQRPFIQFIQFIARHDALTFLVVGVVLMIGFMSYLAGTDGSAPKPPSQACQDYATLSASNHGSTGDYALDQKVQGIIAFAKSECDAGR